MQTEFLADTAWVRNRWSSLSNSGESAIVALSCGTVITFRFAWGVAEAKGIVATVARPSVCLCVPVPRRIPTLLHGPDVSCRNGRGCPLVIQYWADFQSMHGFRCYDNIARTRNVSECLYSLCAWLFYHSCSTSHSINVCNINYFWLVKFSFHLLKLPMFKYVHVFAIRLVVK